MRINLICPVKSGRLYNVGSLFSATQWITQGAI